MEIEAKAQMRFWTDCYKPGWLHWGNLASYSGSCPAFECDEARENLKVTCWQLVTETRGWDQLRKIVTYKVFICKPHHKQN